MQYIKVNDDTFIAFDPTSLTSKTLQKSRLEEERARLEGLMVAFPSDEELLVWARDNYEPTAAQITAYSRRIGELNDLLTNLN